MRSKIKLSLIFSLTFVVWLLMFNQVVAFPSAITLSITPPVSYLAVKPGEKKELLINLENLSSSPIKVSPVIVDFKSDNATGHPIIKKALTFPYIKISGNRPINQKLTDSLYTLEIEAKEKISLPISIDVPSNAEEGEFTMTILFKFRSKNEIKTNDSQAKISGIVGSNLIVLINTNTYDQANLAIDQIKSFPTIDSFMPIDFTVFARNTGKNATPASGNATITNWQNKVVAKFEIHPDMILSKSQRMLRNRTTLNTNFKYHSPFLLGFYKINLQIKNNSDENSEIMTANKTILALPFSLIGLPLIGYLMYLGYRAISARFSPEEKCKNN